MENNPYKPPSAPLENERPSPSEAPRQEKLRDPVAVYTASGNLEAHSAVTWLESHAIVFHIKFFN